jgi:hypothetical protein
MKSLYRRMAQFLAMTGLIGVCLTGSCVLDPELLSQFMESLQGLENVEFNVQVGGGPEQINAGGPPSFVTGPGSGS